QSTPPVMNRPERPKVVSPAGPQLSQPTKTKLAGPKIIRVESPEVIAPPKRSMPGGGGRPGTRTGRGTGPMSPMDMPTPDSGDRGSRRNKRRMSNATNLRGEEMPMGKSSRMAMADENERQGFNWREQDLLERENRLNRAGGFFKAARRDNLKKSTGAGHRAVSAAESGGQVTVSEPITVKSLSAATGMKAVDIVRELMMKGSMVTINSTLPTDAAVSLMMEHNIELVVNAQLSAEQEISEQLAKREVVDERRRSPVVTILGHVDHGKTTLLDKIRHANVAAQEAGGITQATSAFQVPVKVGDQTHHVTFIDTPGHEAFTAMRERGAKVTDIVVLVVAADDGVMPQTVESINHAKAAGVPIVVALNKIDKPEATPSNLQRIYGQLAEHGLNPVEWGGDTELVKTSAVNNQGINDLLEVLDYQAQLRDFKADFGGPANGTVLEASLEEGRGAVARVLVQQGTLHKGDIVVVGRAYGRVRDVVNDRGERINEAEPSVPVAISGLDEVPNAGDRFYVTDDLRAAEGAAAERKSIERQKSLVKEKVTLDNIYQHLAAQGRKELAMVVKADVQGSVETLAASIGKIKSDEIDVSVKHIAVGGINESDVSLAAATGAIIVGFNVTASAPARRAAEDKSVEVRFYDVIYDLIDDVTKAAEGLLEPELKLEVLGHAEVRDVFKISKVGMVAGCYVTDGVIERNAQIRVTRNDIVIEKDRRLQQLKRFKDDAKEVRQGQECGMLIDGYNDIKVGDVLECYRTKVVQRKL
ncbi:MAG TPA: translation initiation factor IF-2, partial [Phycisphaerales bacterium]|nr:translation initiation factor IF-2 [Phycisphaerales bacterium]